MNRVLTPTSKEDGHDIPSAIQLSRPTGGGTIFIKNSTRSGPVSAHPPVATNPPRACRIRARS